MTINPKKFNPIGKWLLVHADPRVKQSKGGIHLPDKQVKVERTMEGSGRILKIGGRVNKDATYALEPGMRVVFRGFLKDASGAVFDKIDDREVFMLAVEDVLAVIDEGVEVGAFS